MDAHVTVELDCFIDKQRLALRVSQRQRLAASLDLDDLLRLSILLYFEHHVDSVHRDLLLVVVTEEDFELALDLSIWALWWIILPDQSNLSIDILVDDALLALDQGVEMEALQLLL